LITGVNEGRMYYYLAKPWDPERLLDRVREAAAVHAGLREQGRLIAELASLAAPADAARLQASMLRGQSASLAAANDTLREAAGRLQSAIAEIRSVREVVPLCMGCGRIRRPDASWQDVLRYLAEHTDFLSHGLCPECVESWRVRFLAGKNAGAAGEGETP
jgi:hypothetical protein